MDKNKTGNLIREARTLATVLDVRIQDIITGNTEVNDDGVVDEVVRIAKLQQKEAKRKVVSNSLVIAAFLYCFISGCSSFGNKIILFAGDSILVYAILMFFSFAFILISCALQNETYKKEINKFCKYIKIVALLSFLWSILLTWCIFIMVINGHIPFGMELTTIGPFINWQLIGLFILNLVINVLEIYRCKKCDEAIHWGWFISIATMYLTVFYGDLLHRMDSTQGAIESLAKRTLIVLVAVVISLIMAKLLKTKTNTSANNAIHFD